MWSNREHLADLYKNFRYKFQIAKRLDNSIPASRSKKNKNQRKAIKELIHNINRDDRSASLVKSESSEVTDENSEGKDSQILTYEIVS